MFEVRTKYTFQGGFSYDHVAENAAGRPSDFSGSGFGERDLGWVCKSEFEAKRMKRALNNAGLRATVSLQHSTLNAAPANHAETPAVCRTCTAETVGDDRESMEAQPAKVSSPEAGSPPPLSRQERTPK
jgi:hypothetical protein